MPTLLFTTSFALVRFFAQWRLHIPLPAVFNPLPTIADGADSPAWQLLRDLGPLGTIPRDMVVDNPVLPRLPRFPYLMSTACGAGWEGVWCGGAGQDGVRLG